MKNYELRINGQLTAINGENPADSGEKVDFFNGILMVINGVNPADSGEKP